MSRDAAWDDEEGLCEACGAELDLDEEEEGICWQCDWWAKEFDTPDRITEEDQL